MDTLQSHSTSPTPTPGRPATTFHFQFFGPRLRGLDYRTLNREPGTIARHVPWTRVSTATVPQSRAVFVTSTGHLQFFTFNCSGPKRTGRTSPRDQWPGGHTFFLSREAFCYVDGTFFKFFTFNFSGLARPGPPHAAPTHGHYRRPPLSPMLTAILVMSTTFHFQFFGPRLRGPDYRTLNRAL